MSARTFRIDWAGRTDRGTVREINEDALAGLPQAGVWLVADGMGGHTGGAWSAQTIVEQVSAVAPQAGFDATMQACADAIHAANAAIFDRSRSVGAQMGSTVVCLAVQGERFGVLWAGDSRAYLLRKGELHRLSRDHTEVQALVDRGLLTPEQARDHPMSHRLSRAVGVEAVLELEGVVDLVQAGDTFVLCSDGLHGALDEDAIIRHAARMRPAAAADALIDASNASGARDNVTVVLVNLQEPTIIDFEFKGPGA